MSKYLLLIVFLFCVGCSGKQGIDRAAVESVANGDSYETVVAKLGEPTKLVHEFSLGGSTSKSYQWGDSDDMCVIGFSDGNVASKVFADSSVYPTH
jgi:hypothetical protein